MGRYARKKGKAASCKGIGRRGGKTKTKTRDLGQINTDIANKEKFLKLLDEDGDKISHCYCMPCARFFQDPDTLTKHESSKLHKRRVKKLKDWVSDDANDGEVIQSSCGTNCNNNIIVPIITES